MTTCPCCSNPMLRHIRYQQVYWFCRNCWQEMPLVEPQSLSVVAVTLERHAALRRLERSLLLL